MEQLIQALQIFLKYGNPSYPTHCEHDTLMVVGYDKDKFSEEDLNRLKELGFIWDGDEFDCFISFRFGAA